MTNILKTLSMLAALSLASGAAAQGTGLGADTLSLGEGIAEGEAQVGDTYVREVYSDWQLRCVKTEEGNDPCRLYQLLANEAGNPVAEISMFALPEGGQAEAGATIITPLETLLTRQVTLGVDGEQAKRYPFTWCASNGCIARVGFTEDDVAAFRKGANATLSIVPVAAPDQIVALKISLAGFTAGYEAVTAANTN